MPDHFGRGATDTYIYLVEYQGRDAGCLGCDDLNRQADARQFAARGDLRQGAQRLAGVGADQEFDLLEAMRDGVTLGCRLEGHAEATAGHAQTLNFAFDGTPQCFGSLLTDQAKCLRFLAVMSGIGRQFLGELFQCVIVGVETFQLFQQALL